MFDPHTRPSWHSKLKSQSPSSCPQGFRVQNSSSPRVEEKQQSTSESNASEAGQLFDPHIRPSLHSESESQSPSFS